MDKIGKNAMTTLQNDKNISPMYGRDPMLFT